MNIFDNYLLQITLIDWLQSSMMKIAMLTTRFYNVKVDWKDLFTFELCMLIYSTMHA